MTLGLVWANGRDRAIGQGGSLAWHVPEDLAHFRAVTSGHPVIMGRRTWESIEPRFRPLPNRRNIVVTSDEAWHAPGAERAGSLGAALALAGDGETWVIGGGTLYAQAIHLANVLDITELDLDVPGADTFAPEVGDQWARVGEPTDWCESTSGVRYRFHRFTRADTGVSAR